MNCGSGTVFLKMAWIFWLAVRPCLPNG